MRQAGVLPVRWDVGALPECVMGLSFWVRPEVINLLDLMKPCGNREGNSRPVTLPKNAQPRGENFRTSILQVENEKW